jgi:hypothetical protein
MVVYTFRDGHDSCPLGALWQHIDRRMIGLKNVVELTLCENCIQEIQNLPPRLQVRSPKSHTTSDHMM